MSYAIIRNEKLTRVQAMGAYKHNERKTKNHSNKNIDSSKTELNYYLKKSELSYIKEFDKIKEKYDLKGQIRSNSNIMCEMVFTSDQEFFNRIGEQETKRYFDECHKFICNYKNLGEENIISAVVHLDEGAPHLHLMFVPVVHSKDKNGNPIEKICARDFWKGRDSYRKLQDAYFNHVKSKGFDLERGLYVEETKRKHMSVEKFKQVTNYAKTKEILKNITLELPETPEIKDIKKLVLNRDEKIAKEIIKPKDELIKQLYNENISLHKELSKQTEIINIAEDFVKEKENMENENKNLEQTIGLLKETTEQNQEDLKIEYENKIDHIENKYQKKIKELEKENKSLNKIIDKFKDNLKKFMKWLCHKFSYPCEDDLIRDFEKETYYNINFEKQLDTSRFQKDDNEMDYDM